MSGDKQYLSFVQESSYGTEPSENAKPVTMLLSRPTFSESLKVGHSILFRARFNCPCCDKGIQIVVDKKEDTIDTDRLQEINDRHSQREAEDENDRQWEGGTP